MELVVVYQPTRGLVNRNKLNPAEKASFDFDKALRNYKTMLGRFAQMGYVVPDLSPLTNESLPDTLPAHDFYFRGDQHWTPYGAQRTAKIVAEKVKQLPAFADIPKREFETHKSGRMGKTGTLHNMAGQLCGTSYAIQYMDQFTTEPKGEAGDGDLFSDSGNPEITLVGTSHSGKNYNFAGFLEEAIGADILNVAFPGGGLEGSMLQYLGSEEFQTKPPKILIWEFSPLYRLDQETIYRQMMALLDNGCEGKDAQMTGQHHAETGQKRIDGQQQEPGPAQQQPPGRYPLRRHLGENLASHPLVHERAPRGHQDRQTGNLRYRRAFRLRVAHGRRLGLAEPAGRRSPGP